MSYSDLIECNCTANARDTFIENAAVGWAPRCAVPLSEKQVPFLDKNRSQVQFLTDFNVLFFRKDQ